MYVYTFGFIQVKIKKKIGTPPCLCFYIWISEWNILGKVNPVHLVILWANISGKLLFKLRNPYIYTTNQAKCLANI